MTEQEGAACVLRLFGASSTAVGQAVENFPPRWEAAARWKSRGAETLVALTARGPSGLKKAVRALREQFPADVYGMGQTTLSAAAVDALEGHDKLLICSDSTAGALLEARLETVPGAEKVYDFGALSYAHPRTAQKIAKRAAAHLPKDCIDPVRLALARAQAARRVVGADLSVGCAGQGGDSILVLSSRKGCWVRTVPAGENAALWLLDLIRRAAAGQPQAEGTGFLPGGRADGTPQEPAKKPRRFLRACGAVLLVLLLAAGAAVLWWQSAGGDVTALPEPLRTLWAEHQPRPGATLV